MRATLPGIIKKIIQLFHHHRREIENVLAEKRQF